MLAVAAELDKLKFPLLGSPKYDGIRALMINGQLLSRKFKPIPNNYVRKMLEKFLPDGMDGELVVRGGNFNDCQSAFMSIDGEPDFEYHTFDYVDESLTRFFIDRLDDLNDQVNILPFDISGRVKLVEQKLLDNMDDLVAYEEKCVSEGYEGIMVRTLNGPYKCGRSTLREGFLLKIKRWTDSEGEILQVLEQMRNDNEAEKDELGHTKRSSCKEGMVPAGTLGKFVVRDIPTGVILKVGTGEGMTKELRQEIWDKKEEYVGRIITYKYQATAGREVTEDTKPNFPIWRGFRSKIDM